MRERLPNILVLHESASVANLVRECFIHQCFPALIEPVADERALLRRLTSPGALPFPDLVLFCGSLFRAGVEAMRIIRADPVMSLLPVLVLSMSRTDFDEAMALRCGADAYLDFPCHIDGFAVLEGRIRELIGFVPDVGSRVTA